MTETHNHQGSGTSKQRVAKHRGSRGPGRSTLRILGVTLAMLTSLLALGNSPATAQTTNIVVSPGESIQAAIDSAPEGATIIVNEGTYTENLFISTDGITLRGKKATLVFPDTPTPNTCIPPGFPEGEGIAVVCVGPASFGGESPVDATPVKGVTIRGFTVEAGPFDGISAITTAGLNVNRNNVTGAGCDGIFAIFTSGSVIERNKVSGTDCAGINVLASSSLVVRRNTVSGAVNAAGINVGESSKVKIDRNKSTGNCLGLTVVDTSDGGFGVQAEDFVSNNVTITRNKMNKNNVTCPFGPDFTIGGTGIGVYGVTKALIKGNTANNNVVSEPSITAGGIVVDDFNDTMPHPAKNIRVIKNTSKGNSSPAGQVDLVLLETALKKVSGNKCGTSTPNANWCS